jgi:hypothetical protein
MNTGEHRKVLPLDTVRFEMAPRRRCVWQGRPIQNGIEARRSGAVEGVGDGRRPGPVQIDDRGRRGPFSGL